MRSRGGSIHVVQRGGGSRERGGGVGFGSAHGNTCVPAARSSALDSESRADQLGHEAPFLPQGQLRCCCYSLSQTTPIDEARFCSLLNIAVTVDVVGSSPTIPEQYPAPPAAKSNPCAPNARDAASRAFLMGYSEI